MRLCIAILMIPMLAHPVLAQDEPCKALQAPGREQIKQFYDFNPCFAKRHGVPTSPATYEQALELFKASESELVAQALYVKPELAQKLSTEELEPLITSPNPKVRFHLARALKKRAKSGVSLLIRLLHDDNAAVRDQAAAALGEIGEKLPSVDIEYMRSEMRALSNEGDWYPPTIYAGALVKTSTGQARSEAIDFLTAALAHRPPQAKTHQADPRSVASLYLAQAGDDAKRADLQLLKLVLAEDTPPSVRSDALFALAAVGMSEAILGPVVVYASECGVPQEERERAAQILEWKIRSAEARKGIQQFEKAAKSCPEKKSRIYKLISETAL